MPKVNHTRRLRAKELLRLVTKGPEYSYNIFPLANPDQPEEQIQHDYKLWVESWIIDELIDLIPELRDERDNKS